MQLSIKQIICCYINMTSFVDLQSAIEAAITAKKIGNIDGRLNRVCNILIQNDRHINQHADGTKTLLQTAVSAGDLEIVEILLCHGGDPKIPYFPPNDIRGGIDCLSEICLMHAEPDRYKIAEFLLKYGASGRTPYTQRGFPLLHICCFYGDLEFVELLFKYDRNVNIPLSDEFKHLTMTPLVFAVRNQVRPENTVQLVKILMDHGEDIFAKDFNGHTLLHAIASNGSGYNIDAMHFLVFEGLNDDLDVNFETASEVAANASRLLSVPIENARDFDIILHHIQEAYRREEDDRENEERDLFQLDPYWGS
jgi:ankyrin repeat protein